MNNVQRLKAEQQGPEQQVRILGRKIGREISPDEIMSITGGIQTISGTYDRNTGKLKSSDESNDE